MWWRRALLPAPEWPRPWGRAGRATGSCLTFSRAWRQRTKLWWGSSTGTWPVRHKNTSDALSKWWITPILTTAHKNWYSTGYSLSYSRVDQCWLSCYLCSFFFLNNILLLSISSLPYLIFLLFTLLLFHFDCVHNYISCYSHIFLSFIVLFKAYRIFQSVTNTNFIYLLFSTQ